ncbi:hypothetical protein CQA66_02025 [Helicobacter aurati]|uniref:Outer membrane family protein n=1 Tax=Helicobacter aurati TaxID=137778 RepID=A0A3D8J9C5_9HELI|nr:outer membrane family protein [Helicobacter aurati]RDU73461.1 hypothetical protein CQA66_02025 [Helicobacter aurati]
MSLKNPCNYILSVIIVYFLFTYCIYADVHSNNIANDVAEQLVETSLIESNIMQDSKKSNLFIQGGAEIFNRTSFSTKQRVPSNSYGYFLGELSLGYDYKDFSFVIGAVGAGLAYDSTRNDSNGALGFNYIGAYPGYLANQQATNLNTHNYFIHNAFIAYKSPLLTLKLGRFLQEDDDWYDSYAEGGIVTFHFADNYYFKVFGSSTYALVGQGWLNDFSRTYFTNGLLNAEFGYQSADFRASIYTYYGIQEFVAPGVNVEFTFGDSSNVLAATKFTAIFPIHRELANEQGFFTDIRSADGFTASILLREDITLFEKYFIGIAMYKNIGNANARMAMFGNPLGIDIWDNSVYVTGASLNASVAPDALSAMFFTKMQYDNLTTLLQSVSLGINGRYTYSPSSDEYSLSFFCDMDIAEYFTLGLILNYYTSVVKNELWITEETMRNNASRAIFDRSYLMTRIAYNF